MKKINELGEIPQLPTAGELEAAYQCMKPNIELGKQLYNEFLKLQAEGKLGAPDRDNK